MPIQFELVTPERLLVSTEVEMVVVPGSEGNFGVLPGHAPLISTIRPGTVDIYQQNRTTIAERIFVASGITEVTPERVTVLADEATSPDSLDRAALQAELQAIEGNLPSLRDQIGRAAGTDRERLAAELRALERQQSVARAKLQVLGEISR
jgi:F-type H+-transporting ATPase subunit epsilon